MAFLGFDEADWMPAVGATYKAAIRFRDWTYNPTEQRKQEFFRPFIGRPEPRAMPYERPVLPQVESGLSVVHYALRDRLEGRIDSLAERLTPGPELVRRCLSPRRVGETTTSVSYGYHVDAGLLGGFLREHAKKRGVHHIVDDVVEVVTSAPDRISHLRTKGGDELQEFYREGLPVLDGWGIRPFLANSYAFIMDGMDRLPATGHPLLETIGYDAGQAVLARIAEQRDALIEVLPDHRTYLTEMYAGRRPTE